METQNLESEAKPKFVGKIELNKVFPASYPTLMRYRKLNLIKAYKYNGKVLYNLKEVTDAMESGVVKKYKRILNVK